MTPEGQGAVSTNAIHAILPTRPARSVRPNKKGEKRADTITSKNTHKLIPKSTAETFGEKGKNKNTKNNSAAKNDAKRPYSTRIVRALARPESASSVNTIFAAPYPAAAASTRPAARVWVALYNDTK